MNSYLIDLECSRCEKRYSAEEVQNLCTCGGPLLARYDLNEVSRIISREDFGFRVHSMWRYKELLPIRNPENMISLSEGFTPLLESQKLGTSIGLKSLFFKDESGNPTGSFKARGLCMAVSRAKELGIREIALPTAGNAGGAASAYAARGGLGCHVFMPEDTPVLFAAECKQFGADVRMVKGVITDAGKAMQPAMEEHGWFNVSTLKEPYRVEGKKTILFELAQQMGWMLPDVILFPTGGGTGIIAAWKAIQELKTLGWLHRFQMPRLIAVQAAGCAPMVRAFEEGKDRADAWENPHTVASGLRVPAAVGDFLILRAVRESEGSAISVSDEELEAGRDELAREEGIFSCPEGGAAWAALKKMTEHGDVSPDERVVLLITGTGLKYAM